MNQRRQGPHQHNKMHRRPPVLDVANEEMPEINPDGPEISINELKGMSAQQLVDALVGGIAHDGTPQS